MPKMTELISLTKDRSDDPRYAVCYARGSSFRPEGNFWRVEKGARALISRALCVVQHYGNRCKQCPNSKFSVTFQGRGAPCRLTT
jgi:hypothetical protein